MIAILYLHTCRLQGASMSPKQHLRPAVSRTQLLIHSAFKGEGKHHSGSSPLSMTTPSIPGKSFRHCHGSRSLSLDLYLITCSILMFCINPKGWTKKGHKFQTYPMEEETMELIRCYILLIFGDFFPMVEPSWKYRIRRGKSWKLSTRIQIGANHTDTARCSFRFDEWKTYFKEID